MIDDIQSQYYRAQLDELCQTRRARRIRRWMWAAVWLLAAVALFGLVRPDPLPRRLSAPVIPVVRIGSEIGPSISLHRLTLSMEKAFAMDAPAVILSIDSPGGDPTLTQRISARLRFLRGEYPDKRVIAVCERLCASAAYMLAIQADEILAGPYSLVGSVGAIITHTNFSEALARLGVKQAVYASGPYKAMLSPMLPPSESDERKARSIVEQMGRAFVQEVNERRPQTRQHTIDTGEIWTADEARALGLIDRIGVIEDVAFGDYKGAVPVVIEVKEPAWKGVVESLADAALRAVYSSMIEVR